MYTLPQRSIRGRRRGRIRLPRLLLVFAVLALLVGLAIRSLSAPAVITNKATMTYADPNDPNSAFSVDSNPKACRVVRQPALSGVPDKVLPGEMVTLSVTVDGAGPEYAQVVTCPTYGGTYVVNSLTVTGTTGAIDGTWPDRIKVRLTPLAQSLPQEQPVVVSYRVKF